MKQQFCVFHVLLAATHCKLKKKVSVCTAIIFIVMTVAAITDICQCSALWQTLVLVLWGILYCALSHMLTSSAYHNPQQTRSQLM